MVHISLVEPSEIYKKSFLEFVSQVKKSGYESYELYKKAEINFKEFIADLLDAAKGVNVEEGWAPCTTFWLVKNLDVYGVIRIRHYLDNEELEMAGHIGYEIVSAQRRKGYGTKILELGLKKAKDLGLDEVIITCDVDNTGSNQIIKKFKAEYLETFIDPDTSKDVFKYKLLSNETITVDKN